MSKEVYAHEGVTLVCTNGMHTSKMTVQDRGVTIANGKKIATEMDKPDMFSCKWAGVVMAMFAAFMIAAPFVVGILLAFIIGMIGAFTVGRYMCKIILSMSSKWLMPHNTVKIKGQKALVENSELFCPALGGQISMFFDPAMAAKQQRLNLFKNSIEILGGAFIGRALHILRLNVMTQGWSAVRNFAIEYGKWYIYSFILSEAANLTANLADNLTSDRKLNEGLGDNIGSSIPFYGSNKTVPSIIASDYARGFTDPLSIKDEYTHYEQHRGKEAWATRKAQSQLDNKQSKIDQKAAAQGAKAKQEYLKENPPHQHPDTKKNRAKNTHKRQEARRKANIEARKQQAQHKNDLSRRYSNNRLKTNATMRLNAIRYGSFAGFFALDVFNRTVQKKLDREKVGREGKARAGVKVVAVHRMGSI